VDNAADPKPALSQCSALVDKLLRKKDLLPGAETPTQNH